MEEGIDPDAIGFSMEAYYTWIVHIATRRTTMSKIDNNYQALVGALKLAIDASDEHN